MMHGYRDPAFANASAGSGVPEGVCVTAKVMGRVALKFRRERLSFTTDDGVALIGELALPEGREPSATLVMLHPLPTAGGSMDSHLLWKAARRLPELADLAVVRFNTRGTSSPSGASGGEFGGGIAEAADIDAIMRVVEDRGLPRTWLFGWSYGTDLVLKHGLTHRIEGALLLAPPLRRTGPHEVTAWEETSAKLVALIPEFDDYLRPAEAAQRFDAAPSTELITLPGANHLCEGEAQVVDVLNRIVEAIGTVPTPLPTEISEDRLQP